MIIMGPEIISGLYRTGKSIQWNFRNVLTLLFFPVAFPVLAYRFVQAFRTRFGYAKRPLEGKVVLLTGASAGIGESLARLLYVAGCRLILASRRVQELERVKADLVRMKTYGTVYVPAVVELDLSDLHMIPSKAMMALEIYGHIDILINNAGISYRGVAVNTSVEVDQLLMRVNYFGPMSLTKVIAQSMMERRVGHIIFISSVQGKIAIPYRSAYTASKHALQAAADSLRAELASYNVMVTVVSPGYVRTNLSQSAVTSSGKIYGRMDESTENGDSPDEVAEKIMSAYFNGEKEIIICSLIPRIAMFLRYFLPNFYFRLMERRARYSIPDSDE